MILKRSVQPLFSLRSATTFLIAAVAICVTSPILALNEPAQVTFKYEVLEPETWVGQELPILAHIDIGDQLKQGNWLVVLYHHDCPNCAKAIPMYVEMARDLEGNEDFLRIALIEVPPYGQMATSEASPCLLGKMNESKEWFVTTPAVLIIGNGKVRSAWEGEDPDLETLIENMSER